MSETQERFHPKELRHIAFVCKCGLEIIHDVASGPLERQNPPRCPKCGESLEEYTKAVWAYHVFYNQAKDGTVTLMSRK
jgi:transcription initiation factor IIE alpha subunit